MLSGYWCHYNEAKDIIPVEFTCGIYVCEDVVRLGSHNFLADSIAIQGFGSGGLEVSYLAFW